MLERYKNQELWIKRRRLIQSEKRILSNLKRARKTKNPDLIEKWSDEHAKIQRELTAITQVMMDRWK